MNKSKLFAWSSTFLLLMLVALRGIPAAQAEGVKGESAWSQKKTGIQALSKAMRAPAFADKDVASLRFAPVQAAAVDAMRTRNSAADTKLLQVGIHRDVRDEAPAMRNPRLVWKRTADGGQVTRLAIASPGAQAIRLGLNIRNIPAAAELRFANATGTPNAAMAVSGAEVQRLSREQPIYWTPVTEGEQQVVEIYFPAGVATETFRFSVESVSHLVITPTGALSGAKLGEAQTCNKDAVCQAQNPGLSDVTHAVARMLFTGTCGANGSAASCLCTGTLLNDADPSTQVPYFYSAAHCISTQSEAATLTTFWNYEAATCGGTSLRGDMTQLTGGALMLFTDPSNDVTLLELNNPAPQGAYFAGWDAAPLNGNEMVAVVHHPGGDMKKISLGQVVGSVVISNLGGNFTTMGFTDGSTQGGSSGSGLFTQSNGEYRLRGALTSGSASCLNGGNLSDTWNRDYFSKLDQVYAGIRSYLMGAGSGIATGGAQGPVGAPTQTTAAPPGSVDYSGAWQAVNENGWGFSMVRGLSGALGVVMYHYTTGGAPVWFIVGGGTFNGSTYSGQLYQFHGPLLGQAYDQAQVSSTMVGTLSINFASADAATATYSVNGLGGGTKSISRISF